MPAAALQPVLSRAQGSPLPLLEHAHLGSRRCLTLRPLVGTAGLCSVWQDSLSPSCTFRINAHTLSGWRVCNRPHPHPRRGEGGEAWLLKVLWCCCSRCSYNKESGTLAYVSQQAWISQGNGRENILFGEKYDHQR